MLTLSENKAAWSASKYYVETLKEYYGDKGEWYGEVSKTLGIEGLEADEKTYLSLAAGVDPRNGSVLVQSKREVDHITGETINEKHRALFDMTFSLAKSGSVAAFVDPDVSNIWKESVKEGLEYYQERYMQTRVQKDGVKSIENTGKGLFALFQHDHNRNGEFNTHIHVNVFNIVQRENGKFAAHHNDLTFIDQKELGTLIRGMAIEKYRAAGYDIEISDRKDLFFDFSGFKDIAAHFSSRREEIEAKVLELQANGEYPNASAARLHEIANKLTRKGKEHFETKEAIIEHGNKILADKGYTPEMLKERLDNGKKEIQKRRDHEHAKDALTDGLQVLQQTEEVWREIRQHTAAARIAGGLSKKDLEAAQGELVENAEIISIGNKSINKTETPMFTTAEMIQLKSDVYKSVAAGAGCFTAQTTPAEIEKWLAALTDDAGNKIILNSGQKDYFIKALTGEHLTLLVQGDPGTGKTFMRGLIARFDREVLAGRGGGHFTIGTAFTGKAASELEGAGAGYSSTIDSFLNRKFEFVDREYIPEDGKRIYIPKGANVEIAVDEASMTGLKHLAAVMGKAEQIREEAKAQGYDIRVKLSLTGDSKQMQAISAGRIFQDLWENGKGMDTALLKDIIRQKEAWYLDITHQLNREDTDLQKRAADALNALEKADKKGRIQEQEEPHVLRKAADRYLELTSKAKTDKFGNIEHDVTGNEIRMSGVVVTARNADKDDLNNMIRNARIEKGEIEAGKEYTVLKSAGLGTEDKVLADKYKRGILLRFNGFKEVMKDNSMGRVVGCDRETNTIQVEVEKSALAHAYGGQFNNNNIEPSAKNKQVINIAVSKDFHKYAVFQEHQINMAVGDEIRFTDNDRKLGVKNGHSGMIKNIDESGNFTVHSHELKRDVVFNLNDTSEKILNYKHVALGYAISTEGSQGMTRDFVIGALKVKPHPASNDLKLLVERTGADMSNKQFAAWNQNLSDFEKEYEKEFSLKDKNGKEWEIKSSIAVADISKNGEEPQYTKVLTARFNDYTIAHKSGDEIRNDMKENGFWFNQKSGVWLAPITCEKAVQYIGKEHPLNSKEYKSAVCNHITEMKVAKEIKEPSATIKSPEAPRYGKYSYNALNVILTRGKHQFDLYTNDKSTLKNQVQKMAFKESLQDYMSVKKVHKVADEIQKTKEEKAPDKHRQYFRASVLSGTRIKTVIEKIGNFKSRKNEITRPDGIRIQVNDKSGRDGLFYGSKRREETITRPDGTTDNKISSSIYVAGKHWGTTRTFIKDGTVNILKWRGRKVHGKMFLEQQETMSKETFSKQIDDQIHKSDKPQIAEIYKPDFTNIEGQITKLYDGKRYDIQAGRQENNTKVDLLISKTSMAVEQNKERTMEYSKELQTPAVPAGKEQVKAPQHITKEDREIELTR